VILAAVAEERGGVRRQRGQRSGGGAGASARCGRGDSLGVASLPGTPALVGSRMIGDHGQSVIRARSSGSFMMRSAPGRRPNRRAGGRCAERRPACLW
jgi:hypothetical protein